MSKSRDYFDSGSTGITRRDLLQFGSVAAAGVTLQAQGTGARERPSSAPQRPLPIEEATIASFQAEMGKGHVSAQRLVQSYLERIDSIDRRGPRLGSVIEINARALEVAASLDLERRQGRVRGPLHGIPIILKDNFETESGDRLMTAAGSRALIGSFARQDATVVAKLRAAGAIILGKSNLSEWANFRSNRSVSGWSARGGQCFNPYVTDRSPCGSSSGSAVAVSANLAAVSLGTETNGSILCPSSVNGCVGIKPTVGLTSRAGVIPISQRQDCTGPICRTVADAAVVLGAMTGVDPRDPATAGSDGHFHRDYVRFLDRDGLRGARIGILRNYFGSTDSGGRGPVSGYEHADRLVEPTIKVMRDLGAVIVDPANLPTFAQLGNAPTNQVLQDEFKVAINEYLNTRPDLKVQSLEDLIAFNNKNAAVEMPFFQQELFILAQTSGRPLDSEPYLKDVALLERLGGKDGIDAVMGPPNNLDALFTITRGPACIVDPLNGDRFFVGSSTPAAIAGYPAVTVPAGFVFDALPIGVSFIGRRWSEPALITFAYAFEQAVRGRRKPEFRRSLKLV